jgi:lipopolysaccharide transport system ATP-binding protein
VEFVPHVPLQDPIVGVSLTRIEDGVVVADVNTAADGIFLGRVESPTRVALTLDRLDVPAGGYYVDVGVYPRDWSYVLDHHWRLHRLEVVAGGDPTFGPPRRWDLADQPPEQMPALRATRDA